MKRLYIMLAAAAALSASAQDLSKEITVDRTVAPEQRDAQRPSVLPAILPAQQQTASLTPAEYTGLGNIANVVPLLQPASWRDSIEHAPYRGYASLGYLPAMNLGANAGYRFVDTDRASAGAWMQYNGQRYTRNYQKVNEHFATFGANGSYSPNPYSNLRAVLDYSLASVRLPMISGGEIPLRTSSHAGQLCASVAWQSAVGMFGYDAAFDANHFSLSPNYCTVKQTVIGFRGGAGLQKAGQQVRWAGVDLDGQLLSASQMSTLGEYHVRPYVRYHNVQGMSVRLGINASLTSGPASPKAHIAPDLTLAYTPSLPFSASVQITGGERLNPLSGLFAINPYINPYAASEVPYVRSNIPLEGLARLNFAPMAGLQFSVFGGYSVAKSWLMPAFSGQTFLPVDFNSWRVGVKGSYAYGTLVRVEACLQAGGSNHANLTWREWYDNAKTVLDTKVSSSPIDRLEVSLAYHLRCKRSLGLNDLGAGDMGPAPIDLGNASSLDLGAAYTLSPNATVFLQADNLLCNRHLLISHTPSVALHGLLGLAVKF